MSGKGSAKVGRHALGRSRRAPRGLVGRSALVLGLVALGQLVLLPGTAEAAGTTYTVSTTADIAANAGACGNTGITTAPSPLSLREATCLANNVGGTVTINVPAGHYTLANGELQLGPVAGSNITVNGAGSASTIIDAAGHSRVFDLDFNLVGGVQNTLSGLTVTNGVDTVDNNGGGGIIGGSGTTTTADQLTLTNVVVTGNQADVNNHATTSQIGGGVQFLGGQLTVSGSTFSSNSSFSSYGSGLVYRAFGKASPESLSITNSTFSANTTASSSGNPAGQDGGALAVLGTSGTNFTVTDSSFTGNSSTAVSGSGSPIGGAIWQTSGNLTVTGSTFTGNSATGGNASPAGGAIDATGGTTTLHYDRLVGNTATTGSALATSSTADIGDNWWGCNAGPNQAGCDSTSGTVTNAGAFLKLAASASPAHVLGPNGTATITAVLTTDSLGATVGSSNLGAFNSLPVSFADPPGDATVTGSAGAHAAAISSGSASIDYHSNTTVGPDNDTVTLDNATVTANIEVDEAPSITSPNTAHFNIGQAGTFTITTTGYPNATISETGTMPTGLLFHDNGDGSATISGTASGAGGNYPLSLTAHDGYGSDATQTLTLNVGQPPAFTSGTTATFQIGTAGSFTVTTSGIPTVSTITESGTLPTGVTFTDNGNGTATIAGTPTGTGNTYPVTLSATNGVSPNASQNLSIQVNQAPAVTTNPVSQTVQPGTSVTFSAAASGVPVPTVQWQRSTDGGASFTNIAGATSASYTFTAALGDNGNQYRAVFSNGVGSPATTTAATLSVGTAPAFTSADHTSFVLGQAGSFAISTTGAPSATLSRTGAQFPAWLTLTDNGDGTGTLTGTPPAGSAGQYQFTLKAANGFTPSASQTFTLYVDASPVITSPNHATFTAGTAGSFAVTTTAGYPTTTALSETGSLPSGVTFHDNGDGTATLAGTPAAATGGTYAITISATASGGLAAPATQAFTLTVQASPVIGSADHATFSAGTPGSFTVSTTAGYPAATTLTKTGTLPAGVSFTDNGDGSATIAGTPNAGSGGVYTITITASNGVAADATQTFTLTVNEPPHISSLDHTTFTLGVADSFTVTTAGGQPSAITITETGSLPAGVSFTDNGNGTATLAGTATAGGSYPITLTASNGVLPNATQAFTLTVNRAPAISSPNNTTFAVGSAGSFTVTTTPGVPSDVTLAESGSLPSGVSFTDNGDGTATLAGTPAAGTGGSYPLTITASNSAGQSSTQGFTLTVTDLPVFTSGNHASFTVGGAGTFAVTTAPGYPTARTLTEVGSLPSGVTFHDNGDGSATLAGTPAAGTGGSYPIMITVTNSAGHTDQAFTLAVTDGPSISSPDHTTFAVGGAGTFTVTTTPGVPSDVTLAETGSLPSGVTFHDNGDGTATLAGTPAAGTGGSYAVTITASNSAHLSSTQSFTLTVTELPAITSANHATFTVGTASSFPVTTNAGYPVATTLTEAGALPSGVSFTDNGDGSATIAGTATSGGTYPITITATNSAGHTDQAFTLTVTDAPVITSADHTTFTVSSAGTFPVTTNAGTPSDTTLAESGSLPSGVSFHDNGDGSATLAGTPAAGTGGSYSLTITATNGAHLSSSQSFTLTVTDVPVVTSPNHTTFTVGTAGTFGVTTRAGYPAATTLAATGVLPAGVSFTDNGNGTATLAGTPAAGSGGSYPITLTATNTTGHTSQTFTLTVAESPTITSADNTTFAAGHAGTFTVTTSGGYPAHPALTEAGALPSGVTFHDNGNGTATLAGTPTTGGVYPITITANNGASAVATQHFTLTVTGAPTITSPNQATFYEGISGSFSVTTKPGVPASPITLTESGTLPNGLTFHDNGNGTATVSGKVTGNAKEGPYKVTITASNGVASSTQSLTLIVTHPGPVNLPTNQPPSNGALQGVPAHTYPGERVTVSGGGYAPNSPIVIGYYPSRVLLALGKADAKGNFSITFSLATVTGNQTVIAAGVGTNGKLRFLEAATVIAASETAASGGSTPLAGGGALADTGPAINVRHAAGYALAAMLAGLGLLAIGRRREA